MKISKLESTLQKQCTRYVKATGKTSILQTKPVQINNTSNLKYLPKIENDIIDFSNKNSVQDNIFTSLEKEIIDKIKSSKREEATVIDKKGNIAKDLIFIGDKTSVRLFPLLLFDDNAMAKFKDSTFIHNHTSNTPLSSADINSMASLKIKKIIACTPNGGFSIMERKVPIEDMNYSYFRDKTDHLVQEEIKEMKALGKTRGITNLQRFELLHKWREERFKTFADEFGLEFKNNISAIDNTDAVNSNIFSVGPIKSLIDNIIIKYRALKG
jgi:hypothetical protein